MKTNLAKAPSFRHWIYEIKFDGWRALALKGSNQVRLLSRTHDMEQERPPIFFYAFDLLQLNGKDMKKLPLEERKATSSTIAREATGRDPLFSNFGKQRAKPP